MKNADRTFASDVYAFGCLCLEVHTAKRPLRTGPPTGSAVFCDYSFPTGPPDVTEEARLKMGPSLVKLLEDCWNPCPEERPSMERVLERFREVL